MNYIDHTGRTCCSKVDVNNPNMTTQDVISALIGSTRFECIKTIANMNDTRQCYYTVWDNKDGYHFARGEPFWQEMSRRRGTDVFDSEKKGQYVLIGWLPTSQVEPLQWK